MDASEVKLLLEAASFDRIDSVVVSVASHDIAEATCSYPVPPLSSWPSAVKDIHPEDEPSQGHLVVGNVSVYFIVDEGYFLFNEILSDPDLMLFQSFPERLVLEEWRQGQ